MSLYLSGYLSENRRISAEVHKKKFIKIYQNFIKIYQNFIKIYRQVVLFQYEKTDDKIIIYLLAFIKKKMK